MSVNLPANTNNSRIIKTKDGKEYEKAGPLKTAGGILAGATAGSIISQVIQSAASTPFLTQVDAEVGTYKDAVIKSFDATKLAQKGIKIIDATPDKIDFINKTLKDSAKGFLTKIPFLNNFIMSKTKMMADQTVNGFNAFYSPDAKTIFANLKERSDIVFHEIGHALNFNKMGVGKVLSKMRAPFAVLTVAATIIGIFKRKKAEGEEPTSKLDKVTTFIKDNCGKLAFIGMTPILLEEGLASIKGLNLAKNFVSNDQLKNLRKVNALAWLTYLGAALGQSVGVVAASKIRDKLTQPKEIQ